MERSDYSMAQVCINGHSTNAYADSRPQHNQQFCDQCGAATITACQHCNIPIRGKYMARGGLSIAGYTPPNFCNNCGQGYPWTESRLQAAEQLADMIEKFTDEDKQQLKESIRNIIRDTPQTLISAVKFQTLMAKAGPVMKAAVWETISEMADDKAKQIINR